MGKAVKKYSMKKILKRQFGTIKEQKLSFLYVLFILNMLLVGILPVINTVIPKLIIDAFSSGISSVNFIIAVFIGISLVINICKVIFQHIKDGYFIKLRIGEFTNLNKKTMEIDYSYSEDAEFQTKMQTASTTLNNHHEGYEGTFHIVYRLLPVLVTVVAVIVVIGLFSPLLILFCFAGFVLSVIVSTNIQKISYRKKDELSKHRRKINYSYETGYDFAYGKDIRLYGLEGKLQKDYRKKTATYLSVIKKIKAKEFLLGLIDLLIILLQDGLAYYFIIRGYYDGAIGLGDAAMYIGAVIALGTALRTIGTDIAELTKAVKLTNDYYEFIDDKSYFTQKGAEKALDGNLEIEFRGVNFRYPGTEKYILKDFNFKIAKGEKLAIVGVNGAGKSTIVKLIAGLFYPTEGEILVNGININDFDQKEYHKMFAVVFQDVNIYACSVLENVAGGDKSDESTAFAKECIERVGLKEKIESLPNGYNHQLLKIIDENGVELSGGESQKLAIARALYKNANMIILDEPTAALDALAEAEIYRNFNDLVLGKTAVYISHRLSSTKFCDHIALFSKEGLLEYGTHSELLAQKGEYYKMFVTQGKYYQEGAANE